MPVSEMEMVEAELLKEQTKPAPAKVSQDGLARFELAAPPNSQHELAFTYTALGSSKVAGSDTCSEGLTPRAPLTAGCCSQVAEGA